MASASGTLILCCILLLTGCAAVSASPAVNRIALLAPFEGRYREIGYNALYASRLALADFGDNSIELLAVDDGGTAESAALHMQAITQDPSVFAIIGLGYDAANNATQDAAAELPYLLVGNWVEDRTADNIYILSNPDINDEITIPPTISITEAAQLPAPFAGGEVIGLEGFVSLRDDLSGITLITSGSLPDAAFRERYLASALYVPEPNHLATLVYDMTNFLLSLGAVNRATARESIDSHQYSGINGEITFADGWWTNAPINAFEYSPEGVLLRTQDIVE